MGKAVTGGDFEKKFKTWHPYCPGRPAILWDHFGTHTDTISGRYPAPTSSPGLDFDLEGKRPCERSLLFKVPKEASCSLRPLFVRMLTTSEQCPVPRPLTLKLASKVTCHVSCTGGLAVVSHHFGTRANVIWGRHPVWCSFTLNLTWHNF